MSMKNCESINILIAMPKSDGTDSFLSEQNIKKLEGLGNLVWNTCQNNMTSEQLREALVDIDVCVCGWGTPRFDACVLEKANRLKLVAYVAGTVSQIVSDELYNKGIRIVSGNEVFAQSVAEGTIAYILASLRQLKYYEQDMRETGWTDPMFHTRSLIGKTVGIVGFGAISRNLLAMLKPFGVKIMLYSRHTTPQEAESMGVELASLEQLFSTCDIVSLHCARNASNYHLIDDRLLSMMKHGALLVNTSRGDVVDEDALAEHLRSGNFSAALDVYETEPLPMDSPLRNLDNVLLQPHLGGPTMDRRPAAAAVVIDDIQRMLSGMPLKNEIKKWRSATMSV